MSAASSRILLFTGKGGVGKTTAAAATALRCADAGLRTMVLSTDPAHSLADAFDVPLAGVGTPITDMLWGQQLDAQERMEEAWGDIKTYASSGEWDVLVVDCAPTAETIRFLSLPDILSWYMERLFPIGRRLTGIVRPFLSRVTSVPVAGDAVFDATRRFYARLDGVRELLTDGERSSVRLVVNPERVVIAEARRTYTYLSLFGYHVDAVIANRLLPDVITDPWFKSWKEAHAEHLSTIEDGFAPLPVLRAELAEHELVGVDRLRDFADRLYGDADAASVLHTGAPLTVKRRGTRSVLSVELPFTDRDDLELGRHDGELLVRVGPYRRALVLPDSLKRRRVDGARMVDGRLEVTFSATAGTTPPRSEMEEDDRS